MNYEEMSDFDINKLVVESLGFHVVSNMYTPEFKINNPNSVWHMKTGHKHCEHSDYCNNALDAWPIIESIWWDLNSVDEYGIVYWNKHCANKLRAAMIVFLKMREKDDG